MQTVMPGEVRGTVTAPPSKSVTQRAIAAAALASEPSIIRSPSLSEDGRSCLRAAAGLGCLIEESSHSLTLIPRRTPPAPELDCGESGLSLRLFTAIAALSPAPIVIKAQGSLLKRPVSMVEEPLRTLGCQVTTANGYPPLTVCGPLQGGVTSVDGATSSQFVSGLLMALPLCASDSTLHVRNLKSREYVALTLEIMERFGISAAFDPKFTRFNIPGGQRYRGTDLTVDGDWSGASFLFVAGALAGRVEVANLSRHSRQADRLIIEALREAGAQVSNPDGGPWIIEQAPLRAFNFDAADCPDLFPPLVALAAYASGTSRIRGVGRLRVKESDRAMALQEEFTKLGATIETAGDEMHITGGRLHGGRVQSHGDHRIAMACAVAALRASSPVEIDGAQSVAKSYPNFFRDLEAIRVSL